MPSYKLTYFDVRGRAETARYLFALADQDYIDERIEKENWPKLKPNTPFGSLPTLQVGDTVICQSHAIDKYLAKKFGFAGKDDLEEAQVDMSLGCLEDTMMGVLRPVYGKEGSEKEEALKKAMDESLVPNMEKLTALFKKNGGDYFVGKDITVADVRFAVVLRFLEDYGAKYDWSMSAELKALLDRVEANPKIAKWIATRPTNSM